MEKIEKEKLWRRVWKHLTKEMDGMSRVCWDVRVAIVMAMMMVVVGLFLLPTVEAFRHHTVVLVVIGVAMGLWASFIARWQLRPGCQRSVWRTVWGPQWWDRDNWPSKQVLAWRWRLVASIIAIGVMVGVGVTQPTTVMEWEAEKVAEIEEQERGWRRDLVKKVERARLEETCAETPDQEACTATMEGWYRANTAMTHEAAVGVGVVVVIGIGVFGLIWLIRLPQRREIALLQERLCRWQDAEEMKKEEGGRVRRRVHELQGAAGEAGMVVIAVITELYASRGANRADLGQVVKACRLRLRDAVLPALIPDADRRDATMERARRERDPDEKAEPVSATPSPSAAEGSA